MRVRHIPTGIAVRCSEERSQAQNKAKAMAILKAKLLVLAEEQRAAEVAQIRGEAVKAEWGQQIRNYVLHPYKASTWPPGRRPKATFGTKIGIE